MNLSWFPQNWFSWIQTHAEESLLWSSYIYPISVTESLSVAGMTSLLLLLVTIKEFFRSGLCEKKLLPLTFSRCVWGTKWKGSASYASSRILHNFDRKPLASTVLRWSFSKTFSIFYSFVLRFSFKMSFKNLSNFLTLSSLSSGIFSSK